MICAVDKISRWLSPVFVLFILLLLAACAPHIGQGDRSATQISLGHQSATGDVQELFSSIQMMNASVGWTVATDSTSVAPVMNDEGAGSILRTTDGGVHWSVVLRCQGLMIVLGAGRGIVTNFHSATVATVTVTESGSSANSYQSRIYHTSDGGQNWQSSVIPAIMLETPPLFIDAQHGWFFGTDNFPGPDPASAYIGGEIALYRTSDGGQSWQKIAHGPSTSQLPTTSDDAYGIVPLTASSRMQFISPTTGWLASTSSHRDGSDFSWLYVTHDAGASWRQVSLTFSSQSLVLWWPIFFSTQQGILPVFMSGPPPQYARTSLLYTTHDGGGTWTGVSVPFDVTNASWVDVNHAWAFSGVSANGTATFYTTSDGWHHWTRGDFSTPYVRIYDFNFVTPQIGWALAYKSATNKQFSPPGAGPSKGDMVLVLKTTDGGYSWQKIAQSIYA